MKISKTKKIQRDVKIDAIDIALEKNILPLGSLKLIYMYTQNMLSIKIINVLEILICKKVFILSSKITIA